MSAASENNGSSDDLSDTDEELASPNTTSYTTPDEESECENDENSDNEENGAEKLQVCSYLSEN